MYRLTMNHRGYQSSAPSPLVQDWISSYDRKHPLLDVGCAFGINTTVAIENGIPVVALDPDERHIDSLLKETDTKYSHLLTVAVGSIPYKFDFPDNHFSGILCSSVFHFLHGNEVEESIRLFNRKLIQGGRLLISTNSEMLLGHIDAVKKESFDQQLAKGEKWPGVVITDEDFVLKFTKLHSSNIRSTLPDIMPNFFHFCSVKQITDELEVNGFKVLSAMNSEHDADPEKEGIGKIDGHYVDIIAMKL